MTPFVTPMSLWCRWSASRLNIVGDLDREDAAEREATEQRDEDPHESEGSPKRSRA